MTLEKPPFLVIFGGKITYDKLAVLHNLIYKADTIIFLGEFGYYYYLITNNLT